MSKNNNVAETAFVIAAFRAEENEAASPLYTDRVVEIFLNEQTKQAAQYLAQNFAPAKEMIKLRTRYFDDVLSNQIAFGCQQVVILGAGLDTRAIRYAKQGVTYFEIDNEATLHLKEEGLRKNNMTVDVRYISGDYIRDDFISLLKNSYFDFNLPSYFLWEGNTTLLKRDDIIAVLQKIRNNAREFKLSFDYMSDRVILRTTGYQDINDYIDKYESMYVPWITGFESIEKLARELELKVVENFSTGDLFKTYRPNHLLSSNLFKFYFVCTLENL